jgi:hypothetical protein
MARRSLEGTHPAAEAVSVRAGARDLRARRDPHRAIGPIADHKITDLAALLPWNWRHAIRVDRARL